MTPARYRPGPLPQSAGGGQSPGGSRSVWGPAPAGKPSMVWDAGCTGRVVAICRERTCVGRTTPRARLGPRWRASARACRRRGAPRSLRNCHARANGAGPVAGVRGLSSLFAFGPCHGGCCQSCPTVLRSVCCNTHPGSRATQLCPAARQPPSTGACSPPRRARPGRSPGRLVGCPATNYNNVISSTTQLAVCSPAYRNGVVPSARNKRAEALRRAAGGA